MRFSVILGILVGLVAIYCLSVPNFVRRGTGPWNSCINNLRMLDSAKQQLEINKDRKSVV